LATPSVPGPLFRIEEEDVKMEAELVYRGGALAANDVNDEIAAFWREFETNVRLREEVMAFGGGAVPENAGVHKEAITASDESGGLGLVETAIVIKFVLPVGAAVAIDIWRRFILPRIETRFGGGTIGEERTSERDDEA
jgi:hypothetical protein